MSAVVETATAFEFGSVMYIHKHPQMYTEDEKTELYAALKRMKFDIEGGFDGRPTTWIKELWYPL